MGTDALHIGIAGEEEERDLDFLPKDTIIALALSLLSLSLFTDIHALTSLIGFYMERMRSGIW